MPNFQKSLVGSGICILIAVGGHAGAADTGVSIKALMTPEQYKAAGLSKLSATEREALYHWLQKYAGKPAAPTAALTAAAADTSNTAPTTTTPKNPQEPATSDAVPIATESVTEAVAAIPPSAATTQAHTKGRATTAALEKNFGLPDPTDEEKAAYQLHSSVLEPFRGWSGKTVFYLENGQIWKQRTSGRHTYNGDDNRVVINQNRLGFYELRLIAVDRSIGVKRLK